MISWSNSSQAGFPLTCAVADPVNASRFPLFEDDKNNSFCRGGITAGLRCGMWAYSTFEIADVVVFTWEQYEDY